MTDGPRDLPPNVTPFGAAQRKKCSRQSEQLGRLIRHAGDFLDPVFDVPYLIKGWLASQSLAVLYGIANVGKTFLALDIAHAIARGEPWAGCRVQQRDVLYVTLEGGVAFERRAVALGDPQFWVLSAPLSFMNTSRDPTWLAEAVEEKGRDFGLIVVDTLARAMVPGDENSAQDMGRLVASAELLKERTRACVLMIHHTGKVAAQGARGHSSLRAAVDTEIEVTKEDGSDVIEAKATKQRDMVVGATFRYRLRQVRLGEDRDGDPVTTCVVELAAEGEKPRRAVKGKAEIALQALHTALERHGVVRSGLDYPERAGVTKEQWFECARLHGLFEGLSENSVKTTFDRAIGKLNEDGLVRGFNGIWWLA